jgi:membrane protein
MVKSVTRERPALKVRVKDIVLETIKKAQEAEINLAASSLAYTTILSIIPFLAVSFSIFKIFGGMERLYDALEPIVFENLAEGADEQTLITIRSFISNIHAGAVGMSGFLGLIVTSMMMLSSVELAINRVWKIKNERTLYQRISSYWLIISMGPILGGLAVGFTTSLGKPFSQVLPSSVVLFPILVSVFYLMYKFIPACKVHWKSAIISSLYTSLSWLIAKAAYGFYIKKVVSYNKIYGSLGAIPILLVWIYVAWMVVIAGAALSSTLQKRIDFE